MARPKRICSIPDCCKKHYAHGYCAMHYARLRKHADPLGGRTPNGDAIQWLQDHSQHADKDTCLLWPFPSVHRGYGIVRVNGRSQAASRVMRILIDGDRPNLEVAHSCGNPRCVNPNHLRWATTLENQHDKHIHGTDNVGERNPMAKLSQEKVAAIRARIGLQSQRSIARAFGVSEATVSSIKSGTRWAV